MPRKCEEGKEWCGICNKPFCDLAKHELSATHLKRAESKARRTEKFLTAIGKHHEKLKKKKPEITRGEAAEHLDILSYNRNLAARERRAEKKKIAAKQAAANKRAEAM
jgi:hypothetical protein